MTTKKKTFDCVEMMHRSALRIHNELKGKTREEQLAYWKQKNEEARAEHQALRDLQSAEGVSK